VTVTVPVRCGLVFSVKVRLTVPLPVPLPPEVIVSHVGALLVAFHAQPDQVGVTPKLVPPAVLETFAL
jgi:hypothetical protein